MLFNSAEYIFAFVPTVFLVFYWLNARKSRTQAKIWLVFASFFFYSWWGLAHLPLIVGSMLVNYGIGTALGGHRKSLPIRKLLSRKALLVCGLAFNLSLLCYFKYANFLVDNFEALTGAQLGLAKIALPLAISFFTFQKIAYLVDSYRGETRGYRFLDYALFVSFFPQLIAGPIVHHKEIVPQFERNDARELIFDNAVLAITLFSIGLFKKVVLADTFASWATPGFDSAGPISFWAAWGASLSYTFQLYFDFSGYTDMAIGSALLFNIRLPINFDSPYRATSIQDFWRRWHITLSSFLRDYVYVPLGGNRRSSYKTYENLMLTFLLGGLWHGASWMFVIWGALHGGALVVHRMWNRMGFHMPTWLGWIITFNFVNVAWVFFRAKDLEAAWRLLAAMFVNVDAVFEVTYVLQALSSLDLGSGPHSGQLMLLLLATGIVLFPVSSSTIFRARQVPVRYAACSGVLLGIAAVCSISIGAAVSEFLYFNF
ncbi:MBOAT family protein [Ramlibacter sp. AN1015]|uniref:MBOAT family O-acyltransferase n=1 Tax=Ramlibacter sp. AN1015 TaxID=3133428 RepID=UPI0030C3C347